MDRGMPAGEASAHEERPDAPRREPVLDDPWPSVTASRRRASPESRHEHEDPRYRRENEIQERIQVDQSDHACLYKIPERHTDSSRACLEPRFGCRTRHPPRTRQHTEPLKTGRPSLGRSITRCRPAFRSLDVGRHDSRESGRSARRTCLVYRPIEGAGFSQIFRSVTARDRSDRAPECGSSTRTQEADAMRARHNPPSAHEKRARSGSLVP